MLTGESPASRADAKAYPTQSLMHHGRFTVATRQARRQGCRSCASIGPRGFSGKEGSHLPAAPPPRSVGSWSLRRRVDGGRVAAVNLQRCKSEADKHHRPGSQLRHADRRQENVRIIDAIVVLRHRAGDDKAVMIMRIDVRGWNAEPLAWSAGSEGRAGDQGRAVKELEIETGDVLMNRHVEIEHRRIDQIR